MRMDLGPEYDEASCEKAHLRSAKIGHPSGGQGWATQLRNEDLSRVEMRQCIPPSK